MSRAEAPRLKRYAKKVAKKAQAREHRLRRELESDEHIEKPRHVGKLKVELDGSAGGRLVAALRGVSGGWDSEPLLQDVDLTVHGRDRIAITGPNGAGKTTLLALLDGTLEPLAGVIDRPVRAAVLHFGLEGDAALRPLGRLSPGERARTAIAAMVAARAEVLLLDEPTNHLDFPSLEVLEGALREYPGAIVAVSHDRAFLDAIGTDRRLRVAGGQVVES